MKRLRNETPFLFPGFHVSLVSFIGSAYALPTTHVAESIGPDNLVLDSWDSWKCVAHFLSLVGPLVISRDVSVGCFVSKKDSPAWLADGLEPISVGDRSF